MNNNMGDYRSRYYKDKIEISLLSVMTTPNCLNTLRIHCRVSRCGKIVQMTNYGTNFLMVIGNQSSKLGRNGLVG